MEVDAEVVVSVDVADVVVMTDVVAVGTGTLEIAEATERPAKPKTDQARILRSLTGSERRILRNKINLRRLC